MGAFSDFIGTRRYCVGATSPAVCGASCTFQGGDPGRCQGSLAVNPAGFPKSVCGERYQYCANGCGTDADGGPQDHVRCL